jgi:glycosyltransferase involved in cell wall biosynthesis
MPTPQAVAEGPGEPGLVSVVIPTYDRAHVLGRAIDSALGQTYRPVEVVLADDGSRDDTAGLAARYGPAVRYFRQANAGVSAARNLGLRQARGEFIALLDSDDAWLPWKLSAQVSVLRRHPDVGVVWTDMKAVDGDGRVLHEAYLRRMYSAYRQVPPERVCARIEALGELCPEAPAEVAGRPCYKGDIFEALILGNLVHTSTVLMRRERVRQAGGFDESLRVAEDYEFHLRGCAYGPAAFVDAPAALYRVGAADQLTAPAYRAAITRNVLHTVRGWLDRDRARFHLPDAALRGRLAALYGDLGEDELETGDRGAARRHLWRSLRLRPRPDRRALMLLFALLPPACLRAARGALRRLRGRRPD